MNVRNFTRAVSMIALSCICVVSSAEAADVLSPQLNVPQVTVVGPPFVHGGGRNYNLNDDEQNDPMNSVGVKLAFVKGAMAGWCRVSEGGGNASSNEAISPAKVSGNKCECDFGWKSVMTGRHGVEASNSITKPDEPAETFYSCIKK
ncbi:MAG: hypothetical protein PHX43_06955 [Alphaproteobacteria bacterium]|nr:hypothetical protein [Alphaproteobacteria bacterium]